MRISRRNHSPVVAGGGDRVFYCRDRGQQKGESMTTKIIEQQRAELDRKSVV